MLSLNSTGMPCSGPCTLAGRTLGVAGAGVGDRARIEREDRRETWGRCDRRWRRGQDIRE